MKWMVSENQQQMRHCWQGKCWLSDLWYCDFAIAVFCFFYGYNHRQWTMSASQVVAQSLNGLPCLQLHICSNTPTRKKKMLWPMMVKLHVKASFFPPARPTAMKIICLIPWNANNNRYSPCAKRDVCPQCAKLTISHRGLIFLNFKNLCCGKLKLLPRYKYQTQGKAHNTTRTEATT